MEIRIKLNTAGEQGAKMDCQAIADAESVRVNDLYIEALQDVVEKHRKDLVKKICAAVKEYGSPAGKYSDGSTDYTRTIKGVEIKATFKRGRDPYFHGTEINAPGLPRFYDDKRLQDVLDLYALIG